MSEQLPPPGETPLAEGSTAEAHPEPPDGGVWDHPWWWLSLVVIGSLLIAGFFLARVLAM
ncbi:DUF6480 family protein [Streptomyces sp. NPDC126514]|uniref:DUF6480 family protein n=1 Tax=Streptomyces sp. NPDC126514 TaxID=3155210 RepID=UPI00332F3F0D